MPRRDTVEDLTLDIFQRGLIPRLNLDSADHVVADQEYRTISNTAHIFSSGWSFILLRHTIYQKCRCSTTQVS